MPRPLDEGEAPSALLRLLRKAVDVRAHEVKLLFLSALYFFLVLTAYYIIRPIREEMGVRGGVENLAWLFTGTLLGTLMVHPLFTWVVARYPRRQFIPIAYRFFAANLVRFFLLMRVVPEGADVAFPYHQVTPADTWIEDPTLPDYNRHIIVDPAQPPPWYEKERMKLHDPAFRWRVEVRHNADPPMPSAGPSAQSTASDSITPRPR